MIIVDGLRVVPSRPHFRSILSVPLDFGYDHSGEDRRERCGHERFSLFSRVSDLRNWLGQKG
jgi:hypothetical protein